MDKQNLTYSKLRTSKVYRCSKCSKLLMKTKKVDNEPVIEIKHKSLEIYTRRAIVVCPCCKTKYKCDAVNGIIGSI